MAQIRMTNGYPSFQEWRDAGYPGAVSFDRDGNQKGTTKLAKCRLCDRSMVANGYCLGHYRIERAIA